MKNPMIEKNVWVIINPKSGKKKYKRTLTLPELQAVFEAKGMQPTFFNINEVNDRLFENTSFPDLHAIVVLGGDGTVRSVASFLVGKQVPLGIIPMGTFNHLAKDLKLPEDLESNLSIIAKCQTLTMDIAEVNGEYFLNNSSIGLYPKAVKHRRMSFLAVKWMAMTIALLNIFKEFPLLKVNYQYEDKSFEVITPLVFISNNQYYLDLLRLSERKKLETGRLYLYINHCRSRLKFLRLLLNVLFHKRKKTSGLFDIQAVKECELVLNKEKVDVAIDGEIIHLKNPLRYRMHPKQLTVIVPEKKR